MKNIIPIVLFPFSIFTMYGKVMTSADAASRPEGDSISGHQFILKAQIFESHDTSGTSTDTVSHAGDYIAFSRTGKAYMNYNNQLDSIDFVMINTDSVSFGDTPFRIIKKALGLYHLYQNEQESNGDYNRATYLLDERTAVLKPTLSDSCCF